MCVCVRVFVLICNSFSVAPLHVSYDLKLLCDVELESASKLLQSCCHDVFFVFAMLFFCILLAPEPSVSLRRGSRSSAAWTEACRTFLLPP